MKHYILGVLIVLVFGACQKQEVNTTRTFYMGMTPWPPDFSERGKTLAYDFIDNHCDIISQHFDEGIPWQEMLEGKPFPEKFGKDIKERVTRSKDKKVFLSCAVLNIDRVTKARYYDGVKKDQAIINTWKTRKFTDTNVINAYYNFIERLMTEFNSEIVNFGVESNHKDWDSISLMEYKYFLHQVYNKLKANYPNRTFIISFMAVDEKEKEWLSHAKILEPCTDWICLSAYPYTYIGSPVDGSSDPKLLSKTLFDDYKNINIQKPLAFGETGFIAQDLSIYKIKKVANQQMQDDYMKYILEYCQTNNAKLLIWFCAYDYNAAINTFSAIGYTDVLPQLWQDIGLYDENLQPRMSCKRWVRWHGKIKN